MRICEVNFGGEIGIRPAVIVHRNNNNLQVLKITTKAKMSESKSKYKLSGLSGVRGYVVTNILYNVPSQKIKRYTGTLFDCEAKGVLKAFNTYEKSNKLEHITI